MPPGCADEAVPCLIIQKIRLTSMIPATCNINIYCRGEKLVALAGKPPVSTLCMQAVSPGEVKGSRPSGSSYSEGWGVPCEASW